MPRSADSQTDAQSEEQNHENELSDIAIGRDHVIILDGGGVWTAGSNRSGQLGIASKGGEGMSIVISILIKVSEKRLRPEEYSANTMIGRDDAELAADSSCGSRDSCEQQSEEFSGQCFHELHCDGAVRRGEIAKAPPGKACPPFEDQELFEQI